MNKVYKRIFYTITALLLTVNFSLAVDSEYKNSLVKVELNKNSEANYNIDLYTQKKFQEPVRVIKKNDLSYYILLPETKNSTTQTNLSGTDIKNVTVNSHKYAGQEADTGYTKINITTSKPVMFNLNIKQSAQGALKQPPSAIASKETANVAKPSPNNGVQKKNTDLQESKKTTNNIKASSKAQAPLPLTKTNSETVKKSTVAPAKKQKTSNQIHKTQKPQPVKKIKNQVKKQKAKQASSAKPKQTIKAKEEKKSIEVPQEILNAQLVEQTPAFEIDKEAQELSQEEVEKINSEDIEQEIIQYEQPVEYNAFNQTQNIKILTTAKTFIKKVINKLSNFAIPVKTLMVTLSSFLVFLIILLLANKNQQNYKLKTKKELQNKKNELNIRKNQTPRIIKSPKRGDYFMLDENTKQKETQQPIQTKKNYELSSYNPIEQTCVQNKIKTGTNIINKVLKDEPQAKQKETISASAEKPAQAPKVQINPPERNNSEPKVLSKVEIATERGFMCVSYKNNISLLGYIFEDVFPLYNFKCQKLNSYDIKYRLTDKDDRSANFIVKIDKTKMVVKVTKQKMNLEVLI